MKTAALGLGVVGAAVCGLLPSAWAASSGLVISDNVFGSATGVSVGCSYDAMGCDKCEACPSVEEACASFLTEPKTIRDVAELYAPAFSTFLSEIDANMQTLEQILSSELLATPWLDDNYFESSSYEPVTALIPDDVAISVAYSVALNISMSPEDFDASLLFAGFGDVDTTMTQDEFFTTNAVGKVMAGIFAHTFVGAIPSFELFGEYDTKMTAANETYSISYEESDGVSPRFIGCNDQKTSITKKDIVIRKAIVHVVDTLIIPDPTDLCE